MLFVNQISYNYWENKSTITSLTTPNNNTTVTTGVINITDRIVFIPSNSTVTYCIGKLPQINYKFNLERDSIIRREESNDVKFKYVYFNRDNTPIAIRNYLTFLTTEKFESEFVLENHWWAYKISTFKGINLESTDNNTNLKINSLLEPNSYFYKLK
jgi:hypothetical protein